MKRMGATLATLHCFGCFFEAPGWRTALPNSVALGLSQLRECGGEADYTHLVYEVSERALHQALAVDSVGAGTQ